MDNRDLWKSEFSRVWGNFHDEEIGTFSQENHYVTMKYKLVSASECEGNPLTVDNSEELYEQGYESLHLIFMDGKPYSNEKQNAILINPLVQVIINRVIDKLANLNWYRNPCKEDLFQDACFYTCKMTEPFYNKHMLSKDVANRYLGYLRKYLYLKLQRFYLTRYLGYKRNGNKYIMPILLTDPMSISSHYTMDDGLINKEVMIEVLEYVGRRNKRYADVINLLCHDLTYQEIADVLGMKLGTVKSVVHRSKPIVARWRDNRRTA